MTIAMCTNCGELKHGALCTCPGCGSQGLDGEFSILVSDHNLLEAELSQIGDAIRVIHDTGLDEEMRFHLLTYFLSRKWPKLLEYDIDAVEPELQKKLDALYRSRLSHLDGQDDPALRVSPIRERTWTTANGTEFQAEEDAWQIEVRGMLSKGMDIASQIVLVQRELEFVAVGVSELRRTSCRRFRGFVPRRFCALLLIPKASEGGRR